MKLRIVAVTASLLICLGLVWHREAAGEPGPANQALDPRALVDRLYTVGGQMPIRDMIAEMECSDASPDTGNMVSTGKDKTYYKFPNKLRIDSVIRDPGGPMDGRQVITIRDGTNAWHFVSTGQYPVKKAPDPPSPTLNLPYNLQRYPQDNARNYELGGSQTIDGVATRAVKITNPHDPQDIRIVYIDVQRNVPLRLEMQIPGSKGGGPTKKRVDYKDIRRLDDGRYMPFMLEIYENDRLQKVRVYSGVKVNVGLQDSLFQPMSGLMR
jgi:outer membrane lipoprotein-sorting protein